MELVRNLHRHSSGTCLYGHKSLESVIPASFLHHPYICFMAMKNRNVIIATLVYMVFFTLLATEHVFEHSYAANILGFDETNLIDLNWYVFAGIIVGCGFTYLTFALRKWRYKTMTAIAFALAIVYLEKKFIPCRIPTDSVTR